MTMMGSCSLNGRLPQAGKYSERLLVMMGSCRALNTRSADRLVLMASKSAAASGDVPLTPGKKRSELYL